MFPKDLKYREPWNVDFKQAKENLINGIDDCIVAW